MCMVAYLPNLMLVSLNTSPEHTLDVGSNLYVDEYGSNVLVVTGNTSITGDLTVDTDVLRVDSTNNKIGINTVLPDAELHVVGNVYSSSNLTVDTDTFHVDVEADHIGINTKYPDAELHVVGNVYASSNLTVDLDTFHVDAEADSCRYSGL
jgi:lipopolysaccharide export system protein LptA